MSDGVTKRLPLYKFKYISNEIKKLPEGENISLEGANQQGALILSFQIKTKMSDEELKQLAKELHIIIDKYLIMNEWNTTVSVAIRRQNISLFAFNRSKNDEGYYWWIGGRRYQIYTGE